MITTVKYVKFFNEKKFNHISNQNNKFIYHVTGQLCQTEQDLYNHFKKELNFPDYFGRNWDALIDCLSDFCWLITDSVTIYISNFEYFLKSETEKICTFWEILLNDVEISWKDVIFDRPDKYVTLNLVFNISPENEKFINDLFKQYNVVESNLNEL